jgi:hypothetical protein
LLPSSHARLGAISSPTCSRTSTQTRSRRRRPLPRKKSLLADSEGAIKRIRDDNIREQVTALQKQCFERMLQEGEGAASESFERLRELSLKQAAVLADLIGECMTWYSTADREGEACSSRSPPSPNLTRHAGTAPSS